MWLDASDASTFTLSGNNVSVWRDKSGNANNATVEAGTPTYTSNGVVFTGSQMFNTPLSSVNNTQTLFCIFTNNSANGAFVSVKSATLNTGYHNSIVTNQQSVTRYGGTLITTGATLTQGVRYLTQTSVVGGGTSYLYLNGTQTGSATLTASVSGSSATIAIGAYYYVNGDPTPQNYFTGTINEIILYYATFTLSQRQQVEGYLAWKWGMQASLPTSHPYYNIAPNSVNLPYPANIPVSVQRQALVPSTSGFAFFNPRTVSGISLWLDGADPNANGSVPSNGGTVSTWVDKSGNGKNATASGTPTYLSGGGISFNGTNAYYTNTSFVYDLSKRSIFIVMKVNTYLQFAGVLTIIPNPSSGNDWTTTSGMPVNTDTNVLTFGGNSGGYSGNIPNTSLTTVNMYNDNMNITQGSQYLNGNLTGVPTANYTALSSSGYGLGARWLSGAMSLTYAFTGNIYEVLLYTGPLSTSQRQQVEGYLAWKWGLSTSLPSNHPYKNYPPGLSVPVSLPIISFQPATFSPKNISGNTLWLDSSDPNATGITPVVNTTISTWFDKSGSGRNSTQATSALQPTYTSSGISFSGANYLNMSDAYNMLNSSGRTYTFFVVEKRGSSNNTQFLFAGSTANNSIFFGYNANTVVAHTTAFSTDTLYTVAGWANPDPIRIWGGGYNGSVRNIVLNGTEVAYGAYSGGPILSWASPMIGYITLASINTYYTGVVYEMLFYNSYLSLNQRQQVEGYLAWKWSLQGNLPANHPFKRSPPPPN